MLTPLALALHEVHQLLSTAREKLSRAARRGQDRPRQAGRVEAFEESESILKTAVTVQREAEGSLTARSYRSYMIGLFQKGKSKLAERVVVPYESEGGLRLHREARDADNTDASTPRPDP